VLDALGKIGRKADFFVFVSGDAGSTLASQIAAYRSRQRLLERADFTMRGTGIGRKPASTGRCPLVA
jgi:hypothetical protein